MLHKKGNKWKSVYIVFRHGFREEKSKEGKERESREHKDKSRLDIWLWSLTGYKKGSKTKGPSAVLESTK